MVLVLIIGDLHIPHRAASIPEPFFNMFSESGRIQKILCCGNISNKETYNYLRTITSDIICVKGEYDNFFVSNYCPSSSENKEKEPKKTAAGGAKDGDNAATKSSTSGHKSSAKTTSFGENKSPSSTVLQQFPDIEKFEIEDFKFGMIHGHQVVPWGDKDSLAMWQRKLDVDVLISGNTHSSKIFEFDNHLFLNPGSITGAPSSFKGIDGVLPQFLLLDVKDNQMVCFTYTLDGGEMKIKKKEWTKGEP